METQINRGSVSYSPEIFVCKLKMKCMSPDSTVLSSINVIIHSFNLFNCMLCTGYWLGTVEQKANSRRLSICSLSTT